MKNGSVELDAYEGVLASMKPRCSSAIASKRVALLALMTLCFWLNRWPWVYLVCVAWWIHFTAKWSAARGEGYLSTAARLILYVAVGGVVAICVAAVLDPRFRLQY